MKEPYPEGFYDWPAEQRDAFFAAEAKAYRGRSDSESIDPGYVPPGEVIAKSPSLQLKQAAAFCAEYEPISYAVEPFVRSSSLYTLTAKTGAGKTALLISIALAVATGRGDLLGRETSRGRVAYVAAENPDDLRMRIMVAAYHFNLDLGEIADDLLIVDKRVKPEDLVTALKADAARRPFSLVLVDTLAAFFDGTNINDPVEAGNFMRRLRPLSQIAGRPSVIVAAHPKKGAQNDDLIPYGAGAILNEVDGNLTLAKTDGGVTDLHWQGKLRGIEFEPVLFRFETLSSPDVKDTKGREVGLPVLKPAESADADARAEKEINDDVRLLKALADNPGASIRELARIAQIARSNVDRALKRLALPSEGKLVARMLGKWALTPAGQKALEA